MDIYINIDEVAEADSPLTYLLDLKDRYSNFKATLYAGLFRCSVGYLELLDSKDWLEICPYGFYAKNRELEWYNLNQLNDMFDKMEVAYSAYYTKGFKAPNFAYTPQSYQVCQERDYWVEMHPNHIKEFPNGMKYCQLIKDNNVFEFSGHATNNSRDQKGIGQSFDLLVQTLDHIESKDFKFCSENVQVNP